jgi:very-short-patch-repair endonuclease
VSGHRLNTARQSLLEARARYMRFNPSASEQLLWGAIRGKRLGAAFRRQVPLGRFVADFYAPARRLVVEVDGGYHAQRVKADARRDEVLRRMGCRVLRLDAELVMRDLPAALARIRAAVAEQVADR